ncbi:GPI ethanolamine phosphate transferase 2 [Linum grandiflorum]
MPQLTCTKLTLFALAAVFIQIIGLSIFVYGFFPVKPALFGVSGVESFYPPGHPGENGSGIHADLPPHQLKSLYQKLSGMSPMFDRLILMVIDGLPAEFVLGKDGKPPRRDLVEAMPYTHSLLSTGRAFGYHAKAAPPTVTMPRLKAMISGAIGGFLDVAFNFNTQALLDDNLLGQFFKIGWKMVMLGDDTWLKLFPGLFARHDGVNSFYLVVSDHGMTESGNHGGSSYEETDSLALFIGFESEMTDQASVTSIHQCLYLWPAHKPQVFCYMLEQVDITPTLALLFNLPVPKNNVGILISETFDSRPDQRLRALELNSWQLLRLVQAELPAFSCGDSEVLDMSDHVGSTTAECAGSIERSLCCLYTKARSISSFWESTRASRCELDSESEYMVAVAAYYDFLNTASEWLSRRVTDRPISLLACGVVAMALSCIILLAILIWMKRKVCTRSQPCTQYVPEFCLQNVFVPSVVLILILSMGSSSMVEEEQYIWHFVTVTSSLLLLRKAWGSLHVGSERGSLTLEQQNQRHSSEVCSIFVLLICGRVLRGWHQGGVNWTHLSDISKWLEKFGSGSIWWIQLVSGLLMISLGLVALCSCWSIGKANHLVALCFSISGLFVLWNIIKYQGNAIASSSYGATTSIQITYATLGFSALSSLLTIPWLMSTGTSYEYSTSFLNLQQSFPIDLKHKALLLEFRDATHVIGLAYILFWCLLQLVLQQPINAMPIFLLMLQVFACMFCNSQVDRDQMEIVEVASLYYMGMAGHFALGNSNTLATIDVAGAFIVRPLIILAGTVLF